MFDYSAASYAIRPDIPAAHRAAWERLARPGSWWSGAERVAIAAEVRAARGCALCAERKQALSPESVQGEHDSPGSLPASAIEVVHRITSDPARLSRSWFERIASAGLSDAHYVELVGILVAVVSIDGFHHALGLPLEPLPEPVPGEPSRYRPARAEGGPAYVPMIPAGGATGAESDLWSRTRTANVIRALSLVPDAVRQLKELSSAHYLAMDDVANPAAGGGRAISRAQIELLAGRVSALNECFY